MRETPIRDSQCDPPAFVTFWANLHLRSRRRGIERRTLGARHLNVQFQMGCVPRSSDCLQIPVNGMHGGRSLTDGRGDAPIGAGAYIACGEHAGDARFEQQRVAIELPT
jgi:hypothetical protein